jgi:hypothetical protein
MTVRPPGSEAPRRWIDVSAAVLIVCSGVLCLLDSVLPHQYEMTPLLIGLALLLLNHAGQEPMRYLYLTLLLLSTRIYLQGDERYLWSEISLFDYILIILAFAASHRLPVAFWKLLFPAAAIALPLGGLISHQLRSGAAALDPFNAGTLSINQTAFLMGACLSLSLCCLWKAATGRRPIRLRLALSTFWALASLVPLALVISTGSRFGVGLGLLCPAIILAVADRDRLAGGWRWLQAALKPIASPLGRSLAAPWSRLILKLTGLGLLAGGAAALALRIYANPQNQLSDMHRLHLLRCYFSIPFSGHNRLVHGMGFTRASQTLCQNIGLIKGSSHAHNIFAQVAADNGLFAMLAILAVAAWAMKRSFLMASRNKQEVTLCAASLNLFILTSLLIEGGWGKVSWIQALMGLAIGSLTMIKSPGKVIGLPIQATPDRETMWIDS